jgi:hypothetical protein
MNSAATELLPSERDTESDEGRLPATEKKWSRRRTVGFAVGASTLLWTLIVLVARGGF